MWQVIRNSLAVLAVTSGVLSFGQNTNSGDIRGTVTDTSGALVPGANVTVLDVDKGVSHTYVTNGDGLYDTGSIVPDHYKVTFTKEGFNTLERGPITLEVGVVTVNGPLTVGSTTQTVEVSTDLTLLKTETGEQSTTLTAATIEQLPQVGADWQNFVILQPGVSGATTQPLGVLNSGQSDSANGNLPYSSVLADGATTTLPMSQNSDISIFDTISEVKISTSAFSAQYGIGGIIYNQISKGGTNRFHGSAYEYFQNDDLNAASYVFRQHLPRGKAVSFLRYNNFGGSIGGPILKDKMFFFFNFDKTLQHGGSNTGTETVPTNAMRQGDFSGQPTIYDPTTQTVDSAGVVHRVAFANNIIPASKIDSVAKAIQAYYPAPNTTGIINNGQTTNNFFYNVPNSNPFTKFFGRLDYDITHNNRLTLSETESDNPAIYLNQGICPVNCQTGDVSRDNAQVSDVWTISPTLINEARFGFTDQLNYFQPFSLNQGYPAKLGWQFAKANVFPQVNVTGACCYQLQPATNAVYKEFVFDPSDVVTMVRGKHVLHFGGEFLINRADSTAWGNINAGNMKYTGVYTASTQGTSSTTGVAYADFLLGQTQSWSAQVTPEYAGRIKSPQMFVQDDIKLRPNLTVNVGVRYQIQTGWTDVKGNMRVFDPTVPNPATATLGAMWYGTTKANGRDRLQSNVYSTVLPRVGFSYQPFPDTVLRGGFGIYAYTWSEDTYGAGLGSAFGSSGNVSDQSNGVSPVVILSSNGSSLAYTSTTTNPAAYNNQNVSYTAYHTPVPKIYQWNFAVQRQLGTNMMAEVAYVGSHGFDLLFPVDINQVPVGKLSPNDKNARPYPQFQGIGGGGSGGTNNTISNYNSLQASIQKRLTSGFEFMFNYTWSHFLDDFDSSGWGSRAGNTGNGQLPYQNAYVPSQNYGSSNFDIRNMFKGAAVYQLPFGQGRKFLNHNRLLDAAIGGWQTAGTIVLQTGNPFTPLMNNNTSYNLTNWQYPNLVGNTRPANRSIDTWFNVAAYASPGAGLYGDARRGSLVGPGLSNVNFSLGKTFAIRENIHMQIRADATNIFNHPSWGTPDYNIGPGHNGQISTTTVNGRTMQLYGRFSF